MNTYFFRFALPTTLLLALAFSGIAKALSPLMPLPGPAPDYPKIDYAEPDDRAFSQGHFLDLYLPEQRDGPVPVVLWQAGFGSFGPWDAQALAAILGPEGYAVAGVAGRTTVRARFPEQIHDIKAAIRWLRQHADEYGLAPERIGIVGQSYGGWVAAMAAVTGDVPELEGNVGRRLGVSSTVQAAIAFYPPTDFSSMDAWALRRCERYDERDPSLPPPAPPAWPPANHCHADSISAESDLLGCTLADCPDRAAEASPVRHISAADPPIMIIHGGHDRWIPHQQGEWLYQALNKACQDAVFISLPLVGGRRWERMLSPHEDAYGATIRSTSAQGCKVELPAPYEPSWRTLIDFLDRALKPGEQVP